MTSLPRLSRFSRALCLLSAAASLAACSDATTLGAADAGPGDADARTAADAASSAPVEAGAAIESIQISVADFVFDARAAGPEDGELVLLLHGFPQTSYEWREQLVALGEAGYRAVAPDQRGYSPGARPAETESYNVAALVGDALGMADALGHERFHVVGHDWGGGVAWGLAGVAASRILTLTAVSTPHPQALGAALEDPESCQYSASGYFQVLGAPDSDLSDVAALGGGFDALPEDATQEYWDRVLSDPDALHAALNWYRANVSDGRLNAPIGSITVPTLYLWGTEDAFFCRQTAEDTAAHVSGPYRFVPVEDTGHWLPEMAPDVLSRELLAHLSEH